ncbi:MAG: hypothetical protein ACOZBH_03995 [Patescibacteria group bacterium]
MPRNLFGQYDPVANNLKISYMAAKEYTDSFVEEINDSAAEDDSREKITPQEREQILALFTLKTLIHEEIHAMTEIKLVKKPQAPLEEHTDSFDKRDGTCVTDVEIGFANLREGIFKQSFMVLEEGFTERMAQDVFPKYLKSLGIFFPKKFVIL